MTVGFLTKSARAESFWEPDSRQGENPALARTGGREFESGGALVVLHQGHLVSFALVGHLIEE